MKYVNDYEAWYRVLCPYCNTDNWYSSGIEQDLTAPDIDAIECRKCKTVFGIGLDLPYAPGAGQHTTEKGRQMVEIEIINEGNNKGNRK